MPYSKSTIIRRAMEEYKKGARCADLAAKYKTPIPTLTGWMRKAGLKFRPVGADVRKIVDDKEIVRLYLSGEAQANIAIRFNCSRLLVIRRLKDANVRLRTPSEQAYISAANLSPERRAERARAAHDAVRGQKRPIDILTKMAQRRQDRGKMTAKEEIWRACLLQHGIATVPQYAVGKYSVDLAIPHLRIAIEACSGWSRTDRKKANDERKEAALKANGWDVIFLFGSKWRDGWLDRIRNAIGVRENTPWPPHVASSDSV